MKNLLLSFLTAIISSLVSLVLIEILIRVMTATPAATWSDRPAFYFRDPANPSMQNYSYEPVKPANKFRIAVIGDSFSFAPYMQFTDTFSAKLEGMLKLNKTERKAEVINYGVPAYSTSHEIGTTKRALSEGADLVLLQITLNDPEIKAHRPSGITENMNDPFAVYTSPKGILGKWKTYNFVMQKLHNNRAHAAYKQYFVDLYENPKTYAAFEGSMTELIETVKKENKPIVAVVFPLFGIAMDDSYPFYPIHEKVDTLLTKLGVTHMDISSIYKGIPLERLQVVPGGDRHPNEIAHRMAAEKIYLWLEELKLIPEEFLIQEKFATRLGVNPQRKQTKK